MTSVSVLLLVRNGSHRLTSPRDTRPAVTVPRQRWHLSDRCPAASVSSSPPASALPVPSPSSEGRHAIEVGDWLIWTRMDWTLFRIFFWCPAKVTPILRRSLQDRQTDRGVGVAVPPAPREVRDVSSAEERPQSPSAAATAARRGPRAGDTHTVNQLQTEGAAAGRGDGRSHPTFPPPSTAPNSLGRHLGNQLQGGEAGGQEAVPVLAHLHGAQPVVY